MPRHDNSNKMMLMQKQTHVDANSDDVWHVIFLSGTDQLQRMIDWIDGLQLQLDCAVGHNTQISKCILFIHQFT